MNKLATINIKYLKGVGEAREKLLAKELDIHTFRDLAYYFPFRYLDRSRFYTIAELSSEMPHVQIRGQFVNFIEEGDGARRRLKGIFSDGTRLMEIVWFARTKVIRDSLSIGKEYVVFGKPNYYYGSFSMAHPEIESYDPLKPPSGLRGVYSLTEALRKRNFSGKAIHKLVENLFDSDKFKCIKETLPEEIVNRYNLMPLREAIINMHCPTSEKTLAKATERMKFEELFYIELNILRYSKKRNVSVGGYKFPKIGQYFNNFFSNILPFELTGAQKKVIREIRNDMNTGRQMNRLLQGDVGSGKTMVAFMTMLIAIDNKCQAALMAPTEILATQHYDTINQWCKQLDIKCALLTGSTRKKDRDKIHADLEGGSLGILIGTHALIEDNVKFSRLGLAVIDEQHRFGVEQRARMWKKNSNAPHILVMTATPIPRTLAMTVYGDLDVSVIDELPPGRKPILTQLYFDDQIYSVDRLIGTQLAEGRQIYIVCPLIRDNEKLTLKSLEQTYQRTCETFRNIRVCCVHGQMKPTEKDYQMGLFVNGEARIMVATTVIEVGVNVPNASVMVIENAERFGLSQLHQLRGRVGRGADQSFCVLMSKRNISATTAKRLNVMTQTTDGFLISEADMKLRGPGDMEGTQQSGIAFNLKVANLARDGQMISLARQAANNILDANPSLVIENIQSTTDSTPTIDNYKLSSNGLNILNDEIKLRFAHIFDWSRIS